MQNMNMIEITERISKYRIFIYREIIIVFIWSLIFTIIFCILVIHNDNSYKLDVNQKSEATALFIFCMWTLIIVPIITWLFYRSLFLKNIKKIEKSLSEAKEYEKDN